MSTSSCSVENQNPNTAVSLYYGPSDPFASPIGRSLYKDVLGHVLSFLGPKDLARAEGVCRSWRNCINKTNQWRNQYLRQLNSAPTDPVPYIRGCRSYKQTLQMLRSKVYDEDAYRHYLGAETESEPIPSLKRFNEPDSCDPTKTIGEKYVWIDSPPYFKIIVDGDFPFELDKPDDPNDEEAPRLIQKEVGLEERFKRKVGLGSKLEKMVLKVPNTINNLPVLFGHPKNGNPSKYDYVWNAISSQHGNKRIPAGPICMREDVIGRNLTFAQQQAAATEAGVVIPQLGHRILYNFLRQAETNTYPDGQNPWTYARTSTVTVDSQGTPWQSGCGGGGPSGLGVHNFDIDSVGVAVALPAEVQDIGS